MCGIYLWMYFINFLLMNVLSTGSNFPQPFKRILEEKSPPYEGKDVVILQNLLRRWKRDINLTITNEYDSATRLAVKRFQEENEEEEGLKPTGIVDKVTADAVLRKLMDDGYKDDGKVPTGYSYKFYIPVHKDRNIETNGILYDGNGAIQFTFRVRARGASDNQLTTNGDTVTGLMTSDLNSKEPISKRFGPYPVIRCVKGIKGNAAIGWKNQSLISNYRNGILIHTGEWDNWTPGKDMPNSDGSMHVYPADMKKIVNLLKEKLGIVERKNPFGKLPYPYEPQGVVSIEQFD